MENGYKNGQAGLDAVAIWIQMDPLTYEVVHAAVGYTFHGEYCGDFEVNPATIMMAK